MLCRICEREQVDADQPKTFDICRTCAKRLGVIPLPPPRRPARPCARCTGMRFTRVIPREYSAWGVERVHEQAAPMTLTMEPVLLERLFGGRRLGYTDMWKGLGYLETYVCSGCGFVEWYCVDPESIPVGPEYMADIVDYGAPDGKPYR
jgi:hypothetical protein